MTADAMGTLISRGVGLGLILVGVGSACFVPLLDQPRAISGWTSYSPPTLLPDMRNTSGSSFSTYFSNRSNLYLPSIAQTGAGAIMFLLSKPIGRWLARGLADPDDAA